MKSIHSLVAILAAAVGLVAVAAEEKIDAKDGVIYSQPDADYVINSNSGSGDGITLGTHEATIRSLRHDSVAVDAVVKLAAGELLRFTTLTVGNSHDLTFSGVESSGVSYPDSDTYGKLYFNVDTNSTVVLSAPLNAIRLHKLGGGDVVSHEPFSSIVSNADGMVYFSTGDTGLLGIKSALPLVYGADCNSIRVSELTVDRAKNGNAGVKAQVVSQMSEDEAELADLIVGGDHDVEIVSGLTLYNPDFLDEPDDFVTTVPDCAVVGSNSVGVLTVNGTLLTKLAIADGELAHAKGAVYVGEGGVVTNYSSTAGESLLGRSGYACLDVAGEYVAYGGWFGAVAGQLSLNVTGSFVHPDSSERGSCFALGGTDAYAAVTVSNGVFDAANATFASTTLSLPMAADAAGVVLTVDDEGLIDLGANQLSISGPTVVNANNGGTLSSKLVEAAGVSVLQLNGGYLRAIQGGQAFSGAAYGHVGGFGYDIPADLTSEIDSSCTPLVAPGKGVESVELGSAVAGRKFIGPPIVAFDGGSGRGASAVAELTDGEVTAIRVTGRGVGYTSAPSAKLVYGTDEIDLGAVTVSDNEAGPILKRGSGELNIAVSTDFKGLEIYGGTLRTLCANAVQPGPLYIAAGATFDAYGTNPNFTFYSGAGSIVNGPVYLTGLVVDMNRVKAGEIDTLALGEIRLVDGAGIRLLNFEGLDRVNGRYVIYRLTGTLPEQMPQIDESTYAAGLSRGWKVNAEGNELVLSYVGGSIYIFY